MSDSERRGTPKRSYSIWILAGSGLALLILAAVSSLFPSGDSRPAGTLDDVLALRERDDFNVVFILVDTLRADHLSAYGYERPTSPNVDALAASGVRFGDHVSQSSWTKCSMASLWTGLYPARSRVTRAPDGSDSSRCECEALDTA